MNFRVHSIVGVAMLLLLPPLSGMASDKESKKLLALQTQSDASAENSNSESDSSNDRSSKETLADEASILEFAKREQLQLFELLQYLKQKRPTSYQQALKETGRTKQRLESLKEKDADLYAIESQLWHTRTKLSLLAAQMSVRDDADLEKQLKALVGDLEAQEIDRITLMRDRTAKQLEKWESQLKDRKANLSTTVEKSVEGWKNRIKKQRTTGKKPV